MFKRVIFTSTLLLFALALVSCAPQTEDPGEPTARPTEPAAPLPQTEEPTLEPTAELIVEPSNRFTFEQLGISLEVPEDLVVIKDPIVNLNDPSKLQSYIFYIQNYGPNEGAGEDYFQIYGHLQFNPSSTVWEDYQSDILNSEMYEYALEIEVNGLPGLDSQVGGQRNRFVYHFGLDGQILSLAVSHPTEENKALADQIISTLEFQPGSVTNASGVKQVEDPNGYYQIYLPADWEVEFSAPTGPRLAGLVASSADAEVIFEESNGPHSNVYYKQGLSLYISVLDNDSAHSGPIQAQITSQVPIMVNGIAGDDYIFTEPSTMEGEIREVRYYHDGLSYLVRINYAENVDKAKISWMIRNFQINQ